MTDNLRDRIAAVIRDHPQGQEWGIPDEECTQCPPLRGIDWAQHVADAVIEALNLKIVVDYMSADGQRRNFMLAGNYTTEEVK